MKQFESAMLPPSQQNEPEQTSEERAETESLPGKKFLVQKLRRRPLIVAAAVLLIGCAAAVNLSVSQKKSADPAQSGTVIDYTGSEDGGASYVGVLTPEDLEQADADAGNYFATAQINRQRARDEAVEALKNVIDSPDALEELKADAVQGISRIAAVIEQEANIESLICAKGFARCVAVINDNSANIVVESEGLLPNEIVQIKEIVCEQSGLHPDAVRIIEMS